MKRVLLKELQRQYQELFSQKKLIKFQCQHFDTKVVSIIVFGSWYEID